MQIPAMIWAASDDRKHLQPERPPRRRRLLLLPIATSAWT